jgi:hypothetical protein
VDVRVGASCSFGVDDSSLAISDSFSSGFGCGGSEFIIVSERFLRSRSICTSHLNVCF